MMSRAFCIAVFMGLAQGAATQTALEPLQLSLECRQAFELTFRFTTHNVSPSPTAAVIGTIVANDKKYLLGHLELTVRRAGMPDTVLTHFDPSASAAIAGRLDPWLIALPPGASYSVTVPAQHFRLPAKLTQESFATPADLRLRLTTQEIGTLNGDVQGLKFIRIWIGTLMSDWLRFPDQCSRNR